MALSTETQAWLTDLKANGGLTDEQLAQIRSTLEAAPKADEFVKGSALRQSDYSRQMDAVRAATAELATKEAAVTKFQSDLGVWKQGAEGKFKDAVTAAETSSTKLSAALNRLKTIAVANGLSEEEVLKDLDVITPTVTPAGGTPPIDTSKFLTTEQLAESVRRASHESAMVDASIFDINSEHQRLFGTPLPSAKDLVVEAIKAGKTLNQYWEEKFNVSAKRTEASEAAIQKRIDTAVAEKTAQLQSEHVLAGQHTGIPLQKPNSPVFKNENIQKPVAADHQGGGGISAALAAHAAGKYRPA